MSAPAASTPPPPASPSPPPRSTSPAGYRSPVAVMGDFSIVNPPHDYWWEEASPAEPPPWLHGGRLLGLRQLTSRRRRLAERSTRAARGRWYGDALSLARAELAGSRCPPSESAEAFALHVAEERRRRELFLQWWDQLRSLQSLHRREHFTRWKKAHAAATGVAETVRRSTVLSAAPVVHQGHTPQSSARWPPAGPLETPSGPTSSTPSAARPRQAPPRAAPAAGAARAPAAAGAVRGSAARRSPSCEAVGALVQRMLLAARRRNLDLPLPPTTPPGAAQRAEGAWGWVLAAALEAAGVELDEGLQVVEVSSGLPAAAAGIVPARGWALLAVGRRRVRRRLGAERVAAEVFAKERRVGVGRRRLHLRLVFEHSGGTGADPQSAGTPRRQPLATPPAGAARAPPPGPEGVPLPPSTESAAGPPGGGSGGTGGGSAAGG
eukprot:TRINITY_DN4684_c4_g1_i1.p1 TRINITY_DN4684_c4_g1~~TRINITY_DN4684_c4_g1_i1.p1  ORF type:complete len:437 (+),score=94.59 TRINITY_DN4684_c4_g1_i1:95-1405(+)